MAHANEKHILACREWIARRVAEIDQLEKRNADIYPFSSPDQNLENIISIEATRFWVDIHRWELDQQIETGSIDEYPQKTDND
jgi:hypothetical protein